eukprot:2392475-Prymnesium_polylepis.1
MHPPAALERRGQHTGRPECPVEPTCPESDMSRVRTRRIGCRVIYAAGQGYCSPVRPMRTLLTLRQLISAPDGVGDATRSRPAGDTHSTRQLR